MSLTNAQLLAYAIVRYARDNPAVDLTAVAAAYDDGTLVPAVNATVQAAIAAAIADQQAQAAAVPAIIAQLKALAASAAPIAGAV